jgi:hypothetical protein
VIALVSIAHSLSHFFQLALPPLFPLLRAEFDVSWTLLGSLVGTFTSRAASPVRLGLRRRPGGARPVLLGGSRW